MENGVRNVARTKTSLAPTPSKSGQLAPADDVGEVIALIKRMHKGDKAAEAELVRRMKADNVWAETLAEGASTMRDTWINHCSSEDFTREILTARARSLKRRLIGDDPTALESLLAERIVICKLALDRAETAHISSMQGESSFKKALFYELLMDRAHRRYVHAIRALAQVQRLQLPVVAQLNVAANQVNVSAATDQARSHVA
jgi:hypothetical protein